MKWYLLALAALAGCGPSVSTTELMGTPHSHAVAGGSSDKGSTTTTDRLADAEAAMDPSEPVVDDDAGSAMIDDAGATTTSNEAGQALDAAAEGGGTGAFAGTGAYVQTTGPSARQTGHNFTGNVPTSNPAGRACFTCHGNGQTPFTIAGTVYQDTAGTRPAAGVEVRVIDKNGTAFRAYTDADGNYYVAGTALVGPALAGVRNAVTRPMSGTPSTGNCNSCHTGGGTARIHVP